MVVLGLLVDVQELIFEFLPPLECEFEPQVFVEYLKLGFNDFIFSLSFCDQLFFVEDFNLQLLQTVRSLRIITGSSTKDVLVYEVLSSLLKLDNLEKLEIIDASFLFLDTGMIARNLKTLKFQNNKLILYKSLSKFLSINRLQNLHLTNQDLGYYIQGVREISSVLKDHKTLQEINLSNNKLMDDGVRIIAKALQENTFITTVNLSANLIKVVGATCLGETLRENNSIQTLILSENNFSAFGGVSLCKGLQQNRSVRTLDLSNSNIQVEGGLAIAQALQSNKTLTDINLSGNFIGASHETIVNTIKSKSEFRTLFVRNCRFIRK